MTETETLTERIALLEEQVRQIQSRLPPETGAVSGRTAPDFLARFSGIFANDPTFDEAVRLGREWRYADRPQEDADQTA